MWVREPASERGEKGNEMGKGASEWDDEGWGTLKWVRGPVSDVGEGQ